MFNHPFIDVFIIIPILTALICVFTTRLMGRKEESCPTWKDKLQMIFIYFACWFCCQVVIYLAMIAEYVYLTGNNPFK